MDFIQYFESKGILFASDIDHMNKYININLIHNRIYEVLLKIVSNVPYLSFSPLEFACASICLARESFKIKEKWNFTMVKVYLLHFEHFRNAYEYFKGVLTKKSSSSTIANNSKRNASRNISRNVFRNEFFTKSNLVNNMGNLITANMSSYTKMRSYCTKKKPKRNFSTENFKNKEVLTSMLNSYVKANIASYHSKDRLNKYSKNSKSSKSNETTNTTPEHASSKKGSSGLNIPSIKKFKYHNITEDFGSFTKFTIQQQQKKILKKNYSDLGKGSSTDRKRSYNPLSDEIKTICAKKKIEKNNSSNSLMFIDIIEKKAKIKKMISLCSKEYIRKKRPFSCKRI